MTVPCPGDTIAHLLGMCWTGPVITAIVSSCSKYQLHCSRLVMTVVVTAPVLELVVIVTAAIGRVVQKSGNNFSNWSNFVSVIGSDVAVISGRIPDLLWNIQERGTDGAMVVLFFNYNCRNCWRTLFEDISQ